MTTYPVTDVNPISIYPSGQQGPVTVYNSGSNTAYVAAEASTLSGIPIEPGNSMQWNTATPLYAYIADVTKPAQLLVINSGMVGTANKVGVVGPLTISNILSPVAIQGGASALYQGAVSVPASSDLVVPLPATAANGLVYPALYVTLSVGSVVNTQVTYALTYGPTADATARGSIWEADGAMSLFAAQHTAFTVPWVIDSGAPSLTLHNPNGTAASVTVTVHGVATAVTKPVTDLSASFGVGLVGMPASDNALLLPGSFDPYCVVCYPTGTPTGSYILNLDGRSITVPATVTAGSPPYIFQRNGGAANAAMLSTSLTNTPLSVILTPALPNFSQGGRQYCRYRIPVDLGVVSGTFTPLNSTSAVTTDPNYTGNPDGSITILSAGLYQIGAHTVWASGGTTANTRRQLIVTVNCPSIPGTGVLSGGYVVPQGTAKEIVSTLAFESATAVHSGQFFANGGDVVRCFAFQDSGSNVSVRTGSDTSFLGSTDITISKVG